MPRRGVFSPEQFSSIARGEQLPLLGLGSSSQGSAAFHDSGGFQSQGSAAFHDSHGSSAFHDSGFRSHNESGDLLSAVSQSRGLGAGTARGGLGPGSDDALQPLGGGGYGSSSDGTATPNGFGANGIGVGIGGGGGGAAAGGIGRKSLTRELPIGGMGKLGSAMSGMSDMSSAVISERSASSETGGGGMEYRGGGDSGAMAARGASVSASAETIVVSHHRRQQQQRGLSPLEQQPDEDEGRRRRSQDGRSRGSGGGGAAGKGTVAQTSLNVAKTCMGTGTLALPYAACRGGLAFNLIGLGLVALWNLYSVDRLLKCSELIGSGSGEDIRSNGREGGNGGDDDETTPKMGTGSRLAGGSSAAAAAVGNNGGQRGPPSHRRQRSHSRCSRHKRTGSSMRKLFSRLMSDRVTIDGDEGDEDGAEEEEGLGGDGLWGGSGGRGANGAAAAANARYGSAGGGKTGSAAPPRGERRISAARRRRPHWFDRDPPPGTATYGRVAYRAFGPLGLTVLDSVMTVLLLGIVVAYECAIASFLGPTPLSTGSPGGDAVLWTVVVMAPLSCVPDMGYLGKFSASGIAAVLATFVVIFWYGLTEHGLEGFTMLAWEDLWPSGGEWGLDGMSRWFGVAAFGYGIVPIAYNVQESMAEPSKMLHATRIALFLVYVSYAVIGTGVAIIYRPITGPDGFEGDVLQELPVGWIPTTIRVAMTFVVLVTAPLLVVPCAQLVEGKVGLGADDSLRDAEDDPLSGDDESTATSSLVRFVRVVRRHPKPSRVAVRYGICLLCAGVSLLMPGFVHVLSFVGAFCVALVGFVFPPLLHLVLLRRKMRAEEEERRAYRGGGSAGPRGGASSGGGGGVGADAPVFKSDEATRKELSRFDGSPKPEGGERRKGDAGNVSMAAASHQKLRRWKRTICVDSLLLIWGIVATAVTSFLTFTDLFREGSAAAADDDEGKNL